jgi:hypothetical protein
MVDSLPATDDEPRDSLVDLDVNERETFGASHDEHISKPVEERELLNSSELT